MKKIIFIAMLLSGSSVLAQHTKALEHFKKAYPKAEDVYWDEYEEYSEASFMDGELSKYVHYSTQGVWLETITEISQENLPEKVKKSLASKTSIDNISSINLIEKASGEKHYEADVETEEASYTLVLDTEGTILKQIKNNDEF